jgi:hypothetical protein
MCPSSLPRLNQKDNSGCSGTNLEVNADSLGLQRLHAAASGVNLDIKGVFGQASLVVGSVNNCIRGPFCLRGPPFCLYTPGKWLNLKLLPGLQKVV